MSNELPGQEVAPGENDSESLESIYAVLDNYDSELAGSPAEPKENPVVADTEVDDSDLVYDDGSIESSEPSEDPSQLSDTEKKALESGWRPKEEFKGDPKYWVDAEEFNRRGEMKRGELLRTIDEQKESTNNLQKQLQALIEHNKGLAKRTREQTIAELKQERNKAVQYADTEAFERLDSEIEKIQGEETEIEKFQFDEPEVKPQQNNDAVRLANEFKSSNVWYDRDPEMTDYMNYRTEQIMKTGGVSFSDALSQAKRSVVQTFSHKFRNPNRNKPSAVMGGSKIASAGATKSIRSLTPEQANVWETLRGHMTEKEFLEQLEGLM